MSLGALVLAQSCPLLLVPTKGPAHLWHLHYLVNCIVIVLLFINLSFPLFLASFLLVLPDLWFFQYISILTNLLLNLNISILSLIPNSDIDRMLMNDRLSNAIEQQRTAAQGRSVGDYKCKCKNISCWNMQSVGQRPRLQEASVQLPLERPQLFSCRLVPISNLCGRIIGRF